MLPRQNDLIKSTFKAIQRELFTRDADRRALDDADGPFRCVWFAMVAELRVLHLARAQDFCPDPWLCIYNAPVNYLAGESTASSADYRRQARRIRASFVGNSFLTQQALGDLAKRRNLETGDLAETSADKSADELANESAGASAGQSAHKSSNSSARPKISAIRASKSDLQLRIGAVVERGFTEHALEKLQPFGFTFSDRVTLLDAAEELGISRFRANLILAMYENQAPARRGVIARPRPKSFGTSLLLIASMEILIVTAVVWLLIG